MASDEPMMADKLAKPQRKLASIQRILDLQPIEGADRIELATVLGWKVIVEKGEFKVDDLVVYCEIDSMLPVHPKFDFLSKHTAPKTIQLDDGTEFTGYRIKTVERRGQLSQGIVFPITVFNYSTANSEAAEPGKLPEPEQVVDPEKKQKALQQFFKEGMDVTQVMDVHKYDPPPPADFFGEARGPFPGFLHKTDETRLQIVPQLLERYADKGMFYVAEKIDGSPLTAWLQEDDGLHVSIRNHDMADDGKNVFWKVAKMLNLGEKLQKHGLQGKIALQGELYGPGMQGNYLKVKDHNCRFFNAYDYAEGRYLGFYEFADLMDTLELQTVPILAHNFKLLSTVEEMEAYADRYSVINDKVKAEGIVVRPYIEKSDPDVGRLSFKVVSPKYLLKHDA